MLNESISLGSRRERGSNKYDTNGMTEDPRTVAAVQPQLCGVKK